MHQRDRDPLLLECLVGFLQQLQLPASKAVIHGVVAVGVVGGQPLQANAFQLLHLLGQLQGLGQGHPLAVHPGLHL